MKEYMKLFHCVSFIALDILVYERVFALPCLFTCLTSLCLSLRSSCFLYHLLPTTPLPSFWNTLPLPTRIISTTLPPSSYGKYPKFRTSCVHWAILETPPTNPCCHIPLPFLSTLHYYPPVPQESTPSFTTLRTTYCSGFQK